LTVKKIVFLLLAMTVTNSVVTHGEQENFMFNSLAYDGRTGSTIYGEWAEGQEDTIPIRLNVESKRGLMTFNSADYDMRFRSGRTSHFDLWVSEGKLFFLQLPTSGYGEYHLSVIDLLTEKIGRVLDDARFIWNNRPSNSILF
jgi:hypothetical protein